MVSTPQDDARAALTAAGHLPDAEIELATVALQFARIDAPEADWRAAAAALSDLARPRWKRRRPIRKPMPAIPNAAAQVLAEVIHARFGYGRRCRDL